MNARSWLPASLLTMIVALPVCVYDFPLSSVAIREAYFLERNGDEKTIEFLGRYLKRMPLPDEGPYISEISLLTPYAQVVLGSWRNTVGYSAQQAQDDYLSHGGAILVKVRIEFTSTYNAMQGAKPDKNTAGTQDLVLRPQGFWCDSRFELSQKTRVIKPRDVHGAPIYDRGGFRGAEFGSSL